VHDAYEVCEVCEVYDAYEVCEVYDAYDAYEVCEVYEVYVRGVLDIASPPACRSLSAYVSRSLVAFLPFFQ
jgi:hypothetical protein